MNYPPGGTPARDAPAQPPATRFVKRGSYLYCVECDLEQSYCNCAKRAAPDASAAKNGAASQSLNARIKECYP